MNEAAAHQSWVELCEELDDQARAVDLSVLGSRAAEAADGLLVLLDQFVATIGRRQIPEVVVEVVVALRQVAQQATSEVGSSEGPGGRLVGMGSALVTAVSPVQAGRAVGLSGRWVQRLCADGQVTHSTVGAGRYLVDLQDLRRYMRERA